MPFLGKHQKPSLRNWQHLDRAELEAKVWRIAQGGCASLQRNHHRCSPNLTGQDESCVTTAMWVCHGPTVRQEDFYDWPNNREV